MGTQADSSVSTILNPDLRVVESSSADEVKTLLSSRLGVLIIMGDALVEPEWVTAT